MNSALSQQQIEMIRRGFDPAPQRSSSVNKICYTDPQFLEVEKEQIFQRSWQFVCHEEKLSSAGNYVTFDIQGQSIVVVRTEEGDIRAFYNVCKHRAHELLQGEGSTRLITCPLPRLGIPLGRFVIQSPKKRTFGEL